MVFHENWYSNKQASNLARLAQLVAPLQGLIIEIGSWEGKSTVALANAVYPSSVIAVDTWMGNIDEGPHNDSVTLARSRDVYATFRDNISKMTKGNVTPVKQDCHEYLAVLNQPVKFCHIDACHDYLSVKRTLEAILPRIILGGVLCGDDFLSANATRTDLHGGVERAVRELLPGVSHAENLWYWQLRPKNA